MSNPDPIRDANQGMGWTEWTQAQAETAPIHLSLRKGRASPPEHTPDESRKDLPAMIEPSTNPAPPSQPRRRGVTQLRWAAVGTDVLQSCSLALRRMGAGEVGSIAVTSTSRGEGRTTVAIGLAAAAGFDHGRETILVDLDLERCSVQSRIQAHPGPGLLDALDGRSPLSRCIARVDDHVQFLRSAPPSDPATMVAKLDRLPELLEELSNEQGALVIADLPPLDSGIVTAQIADLFDAVLLVVRAGHVDLPKIEQRASVLAQQPYVMLNHMGKSRHLVSRLRRGSR